MGIFSKLNKKIEDGPEIDDVEAWLAGDDETPEEPKNRSTDVPGDRSDDSVDVAAAIGPLGTTGVPLTASELIAAAPPADMEPSPPAAPEQAMWNMPDIVDEPDVQWDVPVPEPVAEEPTDPASSGVTTADLAAMVADSNRAGAKPPELSEPMSFDGGDSPFETPGFDTPEFETPAFDTPDFETQAFETPDVEAPQEFDALAFQADATESAAPSFENESLVSFDSSDSLFDTASAVDTAPATDTEPASDTAPSMEAGDTGDAPMPPPPAGEMLAPADDVQTPDDAFAAPANDSVVPDWASVDLGDAALAEPAADNATLEMPVSEMPLTEMPVADMPVAEMPTDDGAVETAPVDDAPLDQVMAEPVEIETIELDGPEHAPTGGFLASMPQGEQAEVLLEILGLEAGATWTEAREARAALLAEHDPDGETDPDRVALALAIRREMNTAYAALRLLQVP